MPIGRLSSLTAHRSWKISSARLRVLQKTSVVLCRSISRITFARRPAPAMAGPGDVLVLGQHDRDLGLGARIALRRCRPSRHRHAGRASPDRLRDRRPWPTGRRGAGPARSPAAGPATARAGRRACRWRRRGSRRPPRCCRPCEQQQAVLVAEQQAQRFGRGQQDLRRPHALARLAVGRACRRSASRPGSAGPSPRSGSADCAARRPPAPSAARCRACAARPSAARPARPGVGRKPASVLPAPVGATSRALRPARAAASISSWCRRGAQPLRGEPVGDRRGQGLGT